MMKTFKHILLVVLVAAVFAAPASAWDSRWEFKTKAPAGVQGSTSRDIAMGERFDLDSRNTFKGTIDDSSGYTVMRNLKGDVMRGYINPDGSGLLQDSDGRLHRVNTRW